jgi:hypothetical protein
VAAERRLDRHRTVVAENAFDQRIDERGLHGCFCEGADCKWAISAGERVRAEDRGRKTAARWQFI